MCIIKVSTKYYPLTDALGTVHALATVDGNNDTTVVERYEYDAFGKPTVYDANWTVLNTSAVGNTRLFHGRDYDYETGLYYYRYRYYEPEAGRFTTPDPLGAFADPTSYGNAYTFCGNNPWSYTDPFGLDSNKKPPIVPRVDWGARAPRCEEMTPYDGPYINISIHHSGNAGTKTPQGLQDKHMDDRGWGDVGYNFMIAPDGTIFEGRSLSYVGSHTGGSNRGTIGINVMGDFEPWKFTIPDVVDFRTDEPTQAQLDAMNELVEWLDDEYPIGNIGGHRDFNKDTDCPGSLLYPKIPTKGAYAR